jgi:hypothetical protein
VFKICTIANDLAQYQAMRDSFISAGFDTARCDFRLYDNSRQNEHDPYHVISSLSAEPQDRYIILCHQDVRIDRNTGYDDLLRRLSQLSAMDARWAAAGNFGTTPRGKFTGKVNDPHGSSFPGPFPQKVISLDENFLVFRPNLRLSCSPGLSGFHLYGTDVCLNAYFSGLSCYVIDFEVTHLSSGNIQSREFKDAVRDFTHFWNRRFVWAEIKTSCTTMRLSKWKLIQRVLYSYKIRSILRKCGLNYISYPHCKRLLAY